MMFRRALFVGVFLTVALGGCSDRKLSGGAPGGQGGRGGKGGVPGGPPGGAPGAAGGDLGGDGSGAAGAGPTGVGGISGSIGGPIGGSSGAPGACVPLPPIERRFLALQGDQVGNATRDLLALPGAVAIPGFAAATQASPSELRIDATYLSALYQMAGSLAPQVTARAAALAACVPGEPDSDCATRFARAFGRKAFRRALDDDEVADILNVFAAVCPGPSASCASASDFADAISLMVKAFILAPSFLYRTELGPRTLTANSAGLFPDTTLTPDEVATQLAFMLLDSTPDADLLAAADSGALETPAGILTQVNRLLALPAVQASVTGLVAHWLGVDRLSDPTTQTTLTNKGATLLSPLDPSYQDQAAIAAELRTSWDRAVSATLWSTPPGKVTDLLVSQTFFADWRLATLYGLPAGSTGDTTFNEKTWPAVQPRAGILTHPAFLWLISGATDVDLANRGLAVNDDIVCGEPTGADPVLTDPYGRLLDAFDPVGKVRTADEAGRPVDATVTLAAESPLGAMTVAGPVAFAQALVATRAFAGCAVQRLFEGTIDVTAPARNSCQVNDLRAAFDQSDGTMASLLREIALSDLARARAGGSE